MTSRPASGRPASASRAAAPRRAAREIFGFTGSLPLKAHNRYTFEEKPAFHWREVTVNHDLWIKRRGNTIKGRMRQQYEFMISKFPIGTFSIYSCLGGAKFTAKAR